MVEIIPKPAAKLPPWQNILLYFSLGLLLVAVLTYFILGNFLKKAETTLQNLEETLSKGKTVEEVVLEKEVFGYQRKIKDFSELINLHLFSSKFFEFIEKNSHPQIWFSNLSLNSRKGEVELSGEAENFTVLHQQLQIFRANPLIKDLNLAQISIGKEGRANFNFNFNLSPVLFK